MKITLPSSYNYRPIGLILFFLYLLPAGGAFYLLRHYTKQELEMVLQNLLPWSLRVNLLLILCGLGICWPEIRDDIRGLFIQEKGEQACLARLKSKDVKFWLMVFLSIMAILAVNRVAPQGHRIFFDEDIYINIGQGIAQLSQAVMANYGTFEYGEYAIHWPFYNKDPNGWPFLISLAFQLLGTAERYAFLLNNLFYLAGIWVAFFLTREIIQNNAFHPAEGKQTPPVFFPAFMAALLYALIPHNLLWSNTAAAEIAAALWSGMAILSLLVCLRTVRSSHFFLSATLVPFAVQLRPESGLVIIWLIIAVVILKRPGVPVFKKKGFWLAGGCFTLLLIPHLLHLHSQSGQNWGAEGAVMSAGFFWNNARTNGLYYLNNAQFPVLFSLLALTGLLWGRSALRLRLAILVWFLFFWGIFLFFYAGSYRYGADVRFALVSFMPLAVLGGLGAAVLRETMIGFFRAACPAPPTSGRQVSLLLLAMLILFWMPFLPLVRTVGQEAWEARTDHRYALEFIKKIPTRAIVLTHTPSIFLAAGQNAIQMYAGINNPVLMRQLMQKYRGHVYFHENYWCFDDKKNLPGQVCRQIKEKYDLEKIAAATEQHRHFGLYRLKALKD